MSVGRKEIFTLHIIALASIVAFRNQLSDTWVLALSLAVIGFLLVTAGIVTLDKTAL